MKAEIKNVKTMPSNTFMVKIVNVGALLLCTRKDDRPQLYKAVGITGKYAGKDYGNIALPDPMYEILPIGTQLILTQE